MTDAPTAEKTVRLDQWLHAVRLFKTRALAASAVKAHRVLVNEQYVKPSRAIRTGDMLSVTRAQEHFVLQVTGLISRRVSATLAADMYAETPQSRADREAQAQLRSLAYRSTPRPPRRPSKRDRRRLIRFVRSADDKPAGDDPEPAPDD